MHIHCTRQLVTLGINTEKKVTDVCTTRNHHRYATLFICFLDNAEMAPYASSNMLLSTHFNVQARHRATTKIKAAKPKFKEVCQCRMPIQEQSLALHQSIRDFH